MAILRAQRGFSLTEVLVVIAMLGILSSLLYAVLMNMRRTTRESSCLGNQQQIARSFLLTAQDNNSYLPKIDTAWKAVNIAPAFLCCPADSSSNSYIYIGVCT